jgi:hypothetical protein
LRDVGSKRSCRLWLCRCDCGNEIGVITSYLTSGDTKSCGCLMPETTAARNLTHGLSHSPEYRVWNAMRDRCTNPNDKSFANYGGRGITVCERWRDSFEDFITDMGRRPSPKHTIERMNNDGPYASWNCRWALNTEQSRNRRGRHWITFNGRTLILAEWGRETGLGYDVVKVRLQRGWSIERALTEPKA